MEIGKFEIGLIVLGIVEIAKKFGVAGKASFGLAIALGLLLFGGIGWTVSRSKIVTFLFLFAVGVSIGAFDELLQSYVPGREMDLYDWIADATGVAAGVGLCVVAGFGIRRRAAGAGPN